MLTAAKLVMRELWLLELYWDDAGFGGSLEGFPSTTIIHIDRIADSSLPVSQDCIGVELHRLADASNLAYGACFYTRSVCAEMKLVCSEYQNISEINLKSKDKFESRRR